MYGRSTVRSSRRRLVAAMGLLAAMPHVMAQNPGAPIAFPSKTITLVIPAPPGGGLDVASRLVSKRLSEVLNVPVVVENRPSVNLLIGTRHVAAAPPDGYTLLAISNTFIGAAVFAEMPGYDPFRDFIPVSLTAEGANLLLVRPQAFATPAT